MTKQQNKHQLESILNFLKQKMETNRGCIKRIIKSSNRCLPNMEGKSSKNKKYIINDVNMSKNRFQSTFDSEIKIKKLIYKGLHAVGYVLVYK